MKRIELSPTRLKLSKKQIEENYSQICVWPGIELRDDQAEEFEEWALREFNSRVLMMFSEKTIENLQGPGGRLDVFFRIHKDDVSKFAIPRLSIGARWWEDVTSSTNYDYQYPDDLLEEFPCTWDA